MVTDRSNIIAGMTFAVFATLAWAFNFIAPYATGAYSIYDLTILRFLIAGAIGAAGVTLCRAQRRSLRRSQQAIAAALGATGYLGYSSCIAAGVIYGGPVLTAAFVGFVPVLLALFANAKEKTVRWHRLALPFSFHADWAPLFNDQQHESAEDRRDLLAGGLCLLCLGSNTVVGLQSAESKRHAENSPCRDRHLDRANDGGCWHGRLVPDTGHSNDRPV
jgi:hypothetical protein